MFLLDGGKYPLTTGPGILATPAKDTVLQVGTNGINGAQNSQYIDSSSAGYSLTPTGTPQQSAISPYSSSPGAFSLYFDGYSCLSATNPGSDLTFGSGNFTIEGWFFNKNEATGSAGWYIYGNNGEFIALWFNSASNTVSAQIKGSGLAVVTLTASNVRCYNRWVHVALVRDSSTTAKLYIGGSLGASATMLSNTAFTETQSGFYRQPRLGGGINPDGAYFTGNAYFTGYMSNIRFVKGYAVYTGPFTPPSQAPLAVDGAGSSACYPVTTNVNTSFPASATGWLACQSSQLRDNSNTSKTLTVTGTISVDCFSPYNSSSYNPTTQGGSVYLDGNSYFTLPYASALEPGSSDFTIMGWIYPTASGTSYRTWFTKCSGAYSAIHLTQYSGENLYMSFSYAGTGWDINGVASGYSCGVLKLNSWNHFVVIRQGQFIRGVMNGIPGSLVTLASQTQSLVTNTVPFSLGAQANGIEKSSGYMADITYVKQALYSVSALSIPLPTVPTTQTLSASGFTCKFTNAGIFDVIQSSLIKANGDARVYTSGGTSSGAVLFDGTGDYLTIPDSPLLRLGSADFTLEGYINPSTISGVRGIISKGTASTGWAVSINTFNQVVFSYNASVLTGTSPTLAINAWTHFAIVRNGTAVGNVKIFVGGSLAYTSTVAVTDAFEQTDPLYIGVDRVGGSLFTGSLYGISIHKAAKYSSAFTPA